MYSGILGQKHLRPLAAFERSADQHVEGQALELPILLGGLCDARRMEMNPDLIWVQFQGPAKAGTPNLDGISAEKSDLFGSSGV
jgi:hypothetical protein